MAQGAHRLITTLFCILAKKMKQLRILLNTKLNKMIKIIHREESSVFFQKRFTLSLKGQWGLEFNI